MQPLRPVRRIWRRGASELYAVRVDARFELSAIALDGRSRHMHRWLFLDPEWARETFVLSARRMRQLFSASLEKIRRSIVDRDRPRPRRGVVGIRAGAGRRCGWRPGRPRRRPSVASPRLPRHRSGRSGPRRPGTQGLHPSLSRLAGAMVPPSGRSGQPTGVARFAKGAFAHPAARPTPSCSCWPRTVISLTASDISYSRWHLRGS